MCETVDKGFHFWLEDLDVGSWLMVGCMEWWTCHSVLAQFSWNTDAVTEVCMSGFGKLIFTPVEERSKTGWGHCD